MSDDDDYYADDGDGDDFELGSDAEDALGDEAEAEKAEKGSDADEAAPAEGSEVGDAAAEEVDDLGESSGEEAGDSDDSEAEDAKVAAAAEDEGEEPDNSDAVSVAASASARAIPQHHRVKDPILRLSNRPRAVRIVPDGDRVTDNRLQKTEAANIIAMRAEQISKYAKHFTDATGLHDPVEIAKKELLDRRCPLKLRREVRSTPTEVVIEEWNVREMALPPI